jgi:hypothetical protein
MQVLVNVVFQVDEARRYILDGREQQLRIALLLLENAAEILMDHRVQTDRENSAVWVRLKEQASKLDKIAGESSPGLKTLLDVPTQTKEKQEQIDRYYKDKVNFLAQSGGPLAQDFADALKHLHIYRNEAYHSSKVRPKTIRTAALILLEINCRLLMALPIESRWSYRESYETSWLIERFGVAAIRPGSQELQAIVDQLRAELLPDDAVVRATLSEHLKDRMAEVTRQLDFIAPFFNIDRDSLLKNLPSLEEVREELAPENYKSKYSSAFLTNLKRGIERLDKSKKRIEAFTRFAAVERDLEALEEITSGVETFLDKQIQMASDIARGK